MKRLLINVVIFSVVTLIIYAFFIYNQDDYKHIVYNPMAWVEGPFAATKEEANWKDNFELIVICVNIVILWWYNIWTYNDY